MNSSKNMSEENKLEKRAYRGNLRLSRKQKTERVRRERINSALDELKGMVCKDEERSDKVDKADILEATVSYVRQSRTKEYQQNPNYRSGYNQCVSEFVQFLITLDSIQAEDKAKLLAGMATILCGVKKQDENTTEELTTPQLEQQQQHVQNVYSGPPCGKMPLPKLHRQPLQQVNMNSMTLGTSAQSPSPNNRSSLSVRVSLSSVGSVTSPSSTCSESSSFGVSMQPLSDSSFDMLDSVFCETSGLETGFGKAVSASINLEVNELSSRDNEEIEEMAGTLPPMCSFLDI
ncbi:transcription factor HES-4-like [Rhopilema esculentum]|uniref:transcription factor HES-4-like n=1 Tax=Rhopilema esculentum TaxID=499914 RepID=UPI0031DC0AD0